MANKLDSATFTVQVPAIVCHCSRLRTIEPYEKTHPQPQAVQCCERPQHCLELRWPIQDGEPVFPTPSSGTASVEFG